MKDNYKCFKTDDKSEIMELLEKWRNNGWNLNFFFKQITHGPGGFHVFYDSRLDESAI